VDQEHHLQYGIWVHLGDNMRYLYYFVEWLKEPASNKYKLLAVLCVLAMINTYGDLETRTEYLVFSALFVYAILRGWWSNE